MEDDLNQNFSIFLEIFENKEGEIFPIIKNSKKISELISFLKSKKIKSNNKYAAISKLLSLFELNIALIPLFIKSCKRNNLNLLFESIFDIYLSKEIEEDKEKEIEKLIKLITINCTLPKSAPEYLYQKMSLYFTNINDLNENLFIKYLNLLHLCYKDNSIEPDNNDNNIKKKETNKSGGIEFEVVKNKEIKNYMYFTGINSFLTLKENTHSTRGNIGFPSLENGCSFVFWLNLDEKILLNYCNINKGKNNLFNIGLVIVNVGKHQIKLILKEMKYFQLIIDKKESDLIEIKKIFNYGEWVNIGLIISKKTNIKIYINGACNDKSLSIPADFPIKEKINEIILFHNLLGKVSSFLFFSFVLSQKMINYFSLKMKSGIYKNKILFKFLISNDNNYFKNSINYKYYEKFKNQKKGEKLFNISLKDHNIKNIISIFCPFAYNNRENILDDICGNYIAIFSKKDDGINYYVNHIKNIQNIGGINNLLPIAELMLISKNSKHKINLLTEQVLSKYLNIFKDIFIGNSNNLYEANKNYFFSNLGLFLEKFPSNIYTEKLLNILLDIGKEIFLFNDTKNIFQNDNYIQNILFNEKIFSKFTLENQAKLWDEVNKFFISDYSIMKESLNIYKFCILLRFYDENRYNEYCCKEHANIIKEKNQNEKNIMNPDMNEKTKRLFEIIKLYIFKFGEEEETTNLYKLLLLDLSPCLQIGIIKVYLDYFNSNKISNQKKEQYLNNLLKNKYFEITEYVYGLSLLDVRLRIIELLILFVQYYPSIINSFSEKSKKITKVLNYIGFNIFPDKLVVEIDHYKKFKDDKDYISSKSINLLTSIKRKRTLSPLNFQKNIQKFRDSIYRNNIYKDRLPLIKYINKDEYNKDLGALWLLLQNWISFETKDKKENLNKCSEINNSVINICISFASKSNVKYVNNLIIYLFAYFNNEFIDNKFLYENEKLLIWIIETIFYYHNQENNKNIKDPLELQCINHIKSKSLEILDFLLKKEELSHDKFKKMVCYIFYYSIYINNKVNEEKIEKKSKKNEISRITSLLLLKCAELSGKNIYFISSICFEFLVCYKSLKYNCDKNDDDYFEVLDLIPNIKKKYENINKDSNIIPSSIIKQLNLFLSKNENINNNNNEDSTSIKFANTINNVNNIIQDFKHSNNNLLKEIWKDFPLYDYIIDYYCSNLWGLENLCKIVKLEYDNKRFELIKKLYKEYCVNKKYKNILFQPVLECFNENDNKKKHKKNDDAIIIDSLFNENILTINLILLSISIEIIKDKEQKEYLENQYEQLLIFCILASINIKPSEKKYDLIQKELYNIIGYGCLYLKTKNEVKYKQILKHLINPFFKEIYEKQKNKGFKKMLKFTKNDSYAKTAVFKLFGTKNNNNDDNNNDIDSDNDNNLFKKSHSYMERHNYGLGKVIGNNIFDLAQYNFNKINEDDKDIINASNINGDFVEINTAEINAELNINKTKIIEVMFNKILKIMNKSNEKIRNNIKIILSICNNDKSAIEEENLVLDEVKKLIPIYIEKLKKYSNFTYFTEKQRKNNYKRCKIKLFSWRGFWSNKYIFFEHPEYLKLKTTNHYTKEMIKPILTPVLDINYYLPKFKVFKKETLFNKNNYYYNIKLDIDDMLKDETTINHKESFISLKNSYGFNYLESIYRTQDEEIWGLYQSYYDQNINYKKIDYSRKQTRSSIIIKKKKKKKKQNDITKNHSFNCCIVKVTNHIQGNIYTKSKYIEFLYDINEENINYNGIENLDFYNLEEEDISYDNEMGCCYGSIFKNHKRDREKVQLIIKYENIKFIFIKNYYYRETAAEIFTEQNKSYFFNFKTNKDLQLFISDVINNDINISFRIIASSVHGEKENKKILGYEKLLPSMKNKTYYISSKTESWQNYNISTLEYLIWINIYGGRSFNDLNQYPIYPWIITNYSSKEIYKKDFRSLNIPIGMLETDEKAIERKNIFLKFYDRIKNDFEETYPDIDYQSFLNKGNEYLESYKKKKLSLIKKEKNQICNKYDLDIPYTQIPYYYGTHYSNPTYVAHYLCRIFPFSFVSIEIHGNKFDDPERMFVSIEKTFQSVTSLKDDIREIIPEFYYQPEMLNNNNNLNLSQDKFDSNGIKVVINDVELPSWSNNSSVDFILEHRKHLESDGIHINQWIDLIFGSHQRGENAEKIGNIYMSYTYEKMIKIMEVDDYDQRSALLRLFEMGVTPKILFKNDTKGRIDRSSFIQKNKLKLFEESVSLKNTDIKMTKYYELLKLKSSEKNNSNNKIYPKISKIVELNHGNLKLFINSNQYFSFKTKKEKEKKDKEKEKEKKDKIEEKDKKEKKEKKEHKDEKKYIHKFENSSSIYAANYQINSIEAPIMIYNNNKLVLKGGFWDGRIELNSIEPDSKENNISSIIFPGYDKPIVCLEMSKDENLLLCGAKDGNIFAYEVNGKMLTFKCTLDSHTEEITSIFINDTLNMFASTSLDGYIMIYILPSMKLVRAIHISSLKQRIKIQNPNDKKNELDNEFFEECKEQDCLYADNIFLSSSPLPSIAIFISKRRIFRTYTINGELINEIKETEKSSKINSPVIYKNLNFQEFLVYGTNDGYIKIRDFPKMNLINMIKIYENNEIKALTFSKDKRYCYCWGKGDILNLISNNEYSEFEELDFDINKFE